jgi:hypothetical protein
MGIMPTLENRRMVTRLIQMERGRGDYHRLNDYHPITVTVDSGADSAYMVEVPFFTPDIPPLKKSCVPLYVGPVPTSNPFR